MSRAAYCTLSQVKASLAGDVPNMGASHDQSLVDKIVEVSRDIDRKVAECRGESDQLFSFLADQPYGQQIVYLSASPPASDGTFVLAFAGQITNPILFDATAADVQTAIEALSNVGDGNVAVSGFSGGPWTVDFSGSMTGPQPTLTGQATVEPTDGRIVVLPTISGVSEVPSERVFRSESTVYGGLLVIDDCVDVLEVREYDKAGVVSKILAVGSDYRVFPFRGMPIYALKKVTDEWRQWPYSYGVVARWGHRTEVPSDVTESAIIEVIRSHMAANAGEDDRLGVTPFGSVITAKAFTSKFKELVMDFGYKLW